MPLLSLATVALQLVLQCCDLTSFVRLSRCCASFRRAADTELAQRHLPLRLVLRPTDRVLARSNNHGPGSPAASATPAAATVSCVWKQGMAHFDSVEKMMRALGDSFSSVSSSFSFSSANAAGATPSSLQLRRSGRISLALQSAFGGALSAEECASLVPLFERVSVHSFSCDVMPAIAWASLLPSLGRCLTALSCNTARGFGATTLPCDFIALLVNHAPKLCSLCMLPSFKRADRFEFAGLELLAHLSALHLFPSAKLTDTRDDDGSSSAMEQLLGSIARCTSLRVLELHHAPPLPLHATLMQSVALHRTLEQLTLGQEVSRYESAFFDHQPTSMDEWRQCFLHLKQLRVLVLLQCRGVELLLFGLRDASPPALEEIILRPYCPQWPRYSQVLQYSERVGGVLPSHDALRGVLIQMRSPSASTRLRLLLLRLPSSSLYESQFGMAQAEQSRAEWKQMYEGYAALVQAEQERSCNNVLRIELEKI
jgi:hypothetical protein